MHTAICRIYDNEISTVLYDPVLMPLRQTYLGEKLLKHKPYLSIYVHRDALDTTASS